MVADPRQVLVVLPVDAPSSLVRGGVYRPLLEHDYRATFSSLYVPRLAAWRTRVAGLTPPLLRRITTAPFDAAIVGVRAALTERVLRRVSEMDRIVLVKYFDASFVQRIRRVSKAKILYDIDDAVWLPEFLGPARFEAMVRAADAVSCDNEYLRQRVAKHQPSTFVLRGPVRLLPVPPVKSARRVVIAWIGSPSTLHYLKNLHTPLKRLVTSHRDQFVFRIVGAGYAPSQWPQIEGLGLETVSAYDEREMHRQLADIDVGVFPLNEDENSLGRGILKATLYMSAAVPAVCSAVGELPSFFEHGRDGCVCATEDDWYRAFVDLLERPALRREMGLAGRNKIAREFSIAACYSVLRQQFLDTP